jgi:hypothetical protein
VYAFALNKFKHPFALRVSAESLICGAFLGVVKLVEIGQIFMDTSFVKTQALEQVLRCKHVKKKTLYGLLFLTESMNFF